jgi:hypothetical protein
MKRLLLFLTIAACLTGCSKFPASSKWQVGQTATREGEWQGEKKISWMQKMGLPKDSQVIEFLEKSGLKIGSVEPVAYEETKEGRTVTYQVYAMVPTRLYRMTSQKWNPQDKELQRFGKVLVFNPGLPAGEAWNTERAGVAAEAGKKINFLWRMNEDKVFKVVTTDALIFGNNLFTEQQVRDAQSQTASAIADLQGEVSRIKQKVADFKASQLASIPGDPKRPELLSRKWGGSGSGEPTKTAVRGVGGAAGGAAIGGIAGGGDGAAIGAGAGFLAGLIYDGVSKSNDREEHERAVDAENNRRLSAWNAEKKELNARRAEVKKQAAQMEDQLMNELEARIASQNGRVRASEGVGQQPGSQPATDAGKVNL